MCVCVRRFALCVLLPVRARIYREQVIADRERLACPVHAMRIVGDADGGDDDDDDDDGDDSPADRRQRPSSKSAHTHTRSHDGDEGVVRLFASTLRCTARNRRRIIEIVRTACCGAYVDGAPVARFASAALYAYAHTHRQSEHI